MTYKYTEDDYCDLFSKKICDNCGKCLEEDGIDIRAINIDDIAKTVEENSFIEEELKNALEALKEEEKDSEENINEEITRSELGIGTEDIVLSFCGYLSKRKNASYLINAIKKISRKDIFLLLIGDGK